MPVSAPIARFVFQPEAFAEDSYSVREALREVSETFDSTVNGIAGDWTPQLQFGGASAGVGYNLQQGEWVRWGQMAYLTMRFALNNKGSSTGRATIANLPFPVADRLTGTALEGMAYVGYGVYMSGLTGAVSGNVEESGAIMLRHWGPTGTTDLTDGNFTNSTQLSVQALYITDEV